MSNMVNSSIYYVYVISRTHVQNSLGSSIMKSLKESWDQEFMNHQYSDSKAENRKTVLPII